MTDLAPRHLDAGGGAEAGARCLRSGSESGGACFRPSRSSGGRGFSFAQLRRLEYGSPEGKPGQRHDTASPQEVKDPFALEGLAQLPLAESSSTLWGYLASDQFLHRVLKGERLLQVVPHEGSAEEVRQRSKDLLAQAWRVQWLTKPSK